MLEGKPLPLPRSSTASTSSLYLRLDPTSLVSADCPGPVPKCSAFIFVFICQISEALVPHHTTPQNIKLESLPNPGRSVDKGWQAQLMECSACPRLGCFLLCSSSNHRGAVKKECCRWSGRRQARDGQTNRQIWWSYEKGTCAFTASINNTNDFHSEALKKNRITRVSSRSSKSNKHVISKNKSLLASRNQYHINKYCRLEQTVMMDKNQYNL